MSATGGTVTTYGVYTVHTFTSSGTFTVSGGAITADFLLIGGGGAGSYNWGAGGGAGGMVVGTSQSISAGSYSIVVGAGAVGVANTDAGDNGSDSTFSTFVAKGGGGGGQRFSPNPGQPGGSGGGGGGGLSTASTGGASTQDTYSGTSGVTGYGNSGGSGKNPYPGRRGGGGGGAGEAGWNYNSSGKKSNGGDGLQNNFRTGSNQWYAGGGGGAANNSVPYGIGGQGGGGRGGNHAGQTVTNPLATSGTANTGSGGGGMSWTASSPPPAPGSGGSGIFVLRYEAPTTPNAPSGLTSSVSSNSISLSWNASTVPSGGSAVSGYKIEESTDNSNWTTIVTNTGSSGITYTRNVSYDGVYYHKVSGINGEGIGSSSSVNSSSVSGQPPSPPTGLTTGLTSTPTFTTSEKSDLQVEFVVDYNNSSSSTSWMPIYASSGNHSNKGLTDGADGDNISSSHWTYSSTNGFTMVGSEPLDVYAYQNKTPLTAVSNTHGAGITVEVWIKVNNSTAWNAGSWNNPRGWIWSNALGGGWAAGGVVKDDRINNSNIGMTPGSDTSSVTTTTGAYGSTTFTSKFGSSGTLAQSKNGWDHLMFSYYNDAGTIRRRGYINGWYYQQNSPSSFPANASYNIVIGQTAHGKPISNCATGLGFYSVRIWNKFVNQALATKIYNNGHDGSVEHSTTTAAGEIQGKTLLSWTAGYSTVTGYKVEYSEDNSNWTVFSANTGNTNTSLEITGLSNSVSTFYFRVSSISSGGTTAGSVLTAHLFLPQKPTNLTATKSGANANLAWTAPTDTGNEAITSYKIEYSDDNTNWNTEKASTGSVSVTYTFLGIGSGTTYFRVSAISTAPGVVSDTASLNVTGSGHPVKATGVSASVAPGASAVSWSAVSGATSYKILYSTNNTNWTVSSSSATGTSHTVTGIAGGTLHYYKVAGINAVGLGVFSDAVSATTSALAEPGVPTGLSWISEGNSVTLSWTAPANNGSVITGYKIEKSEDNSTWNTALSSTGSTAVTYTDAVGVFGGQTYYYRVSAINAIGTGSASSAVQVTVAVDTTEMGVHLGVGNNTLEHHFLTPHNGNFFAPEMDIHKNLRLNELSSTPTAPAAGEGIFLYTKTDKKLYYSSSQSSETVLVGSGTSFTKHGSGLATTTSIGINTNPSSIKKLYVGGTFGTTGTLTVGSNTFPKEDGAANHYIRTDGSGNLFWDSAGTPFTSTALTLTDIYSANLSSALQDTNAATTYYCWSSSVDTSDLKYTTGTTQGANSLFHIKSPGDYTINAVIHLNDATADDRAGFHVIVRWYTGQNNNTTRGTAELDYSIGNAYVRSSTDPYDCAFPGGTLSRYVTQAQVSAGIQFEIVSLRLFSQDSTDDNPANQTLSKIRIEKTGINLS